MAAQIPDTKRGSYRRIRAALSEKGAFVEGDQAVTPAGEAEIRELYEAWIAKLPGADAGERGD